MTVHATLVTFELHSLGWKAFQDLCSTVLSEILGQTFQTFLPTNDEGRDGSFQGHWKTKTGESFEGAFTVQCKFTAKRDKNLTLANLRDELEKAKELGTRRLAETYLLMTNAGITAESEAQMQTAFLALPGIRHFAAFHGDWFNQRIRESQRLRMLVPRVYGLGDLTQVLDQRAYRQAQEILNVFGEELAKFVITDAHQRTIRALMRGGFVLLLGGPASGKTTIALAVALAAADQWGRAPIRIRDAGDFERHWNPDEPRQFFWVDDAFGERQFHSELAANWSRTFQHLRAAVKKGAWVLFTSRDYIFQAARSHLKESAFPLLHDSAVTIDVQSLSLQEREQILYNHVRLGNQPSAFRTAIKPYLPSVAKNPAFLPETARRLADPFFTRALRLSESSLCTFVEKPISFLVEVIQHLDNASRAALAFLFMRGGEAVTPIDFSVEEQEEIQLIGASKWEILEALKSLKNSLVIERLESGRTTWRFKHPTVRDAFAALIFGDNNLLDIYLRGTPVEKLMNEIVCGDVDLEGARVIVPESRFELLLKKLDALDWQNGTDDWRLATFLRWRCSDSFLRVWAEQRSHQMERYCEHPTRAAWVMARLHRIHFLPEALRQRYVQSAGHEAVVTPDAAFLEPELRDMFAADEWSTLRQRLVDEVYRHIADILDTWNSNYDYLGDEEPEDYFEPLLSAFDAFESEFMTARTDHNGLLIDWPVSQGFGEASAKIKRLVQKWGEKREQREAEEMEKRRIAEAERESWLAHLLNSCKPPQATLKASNPPSLEETARSIFEDVDQ